MNKQDRKLIAQAKQAALKILLHNNSGNFENLPRVAGWGYPEPYTRDLMICSLGFFVSKNKILLNTFTRVLETLAKNQSLHGSIPSLVHNPNDRGASDTTPLFLMAVAMYRKYIHKNKFLEKAVKKSLKWMEYQSPCDCVSVTQLPTSDWRDEQWVLGYGLYVNSITYAYLRLLGLNSRADWLHYDLTKIGREGLVIKSKPYFALWSYKVYMSKRFDLLGNSLAILTGLASMARAEKIIDWAENQCQKLKADRQLAVDLPPCLFPYIQPQDSDWMRRYRKFNPPGNYHNGGIWPFTCGFYIAALVAAGRHHLAHDKLISLTNLIYLSKRGRISYGFNEWYKAQTGKPSGQDWQSWSAAMYLYAAHCVEHNETPFFDEIRKRPPPNRTKTEKA
ncbi:MAG: glycoside hydrolase 100 family protein [Phycisphaerales bacterium]